MKRPQGRRLTRAEASALEKAAGYFLHAWETYGGKEFEATAGLTNRQRRALWKHLNAAQDHLIEALTLPTAKAPATRE